MDRTSMRGWLAAAALLALLGVGTVGFGRSVSAQEATPAATADVSTVTVNGNGSVTVTPDAAMISIGVNVVNANLSEAQAAATTAMMSVIDALKAAGVDEKDI